MPWIRKLTHSTHIFLVQNYAPSKKGTGDLPPQIKSEIFGETPIIGQLLTLFQDLNPKLSITLVIWKVICLSAYLRNADQQALILFMQKHEKNGKFFKTLATCFIHHNLEPNGFHIIPNHAARPVSVTILHLSRTFPNEKIFQESEYNWDVKGNKSPLVTYHLYGNPDFCSLCWLFHESNFWNLYHASCFSMLLFFPWTGGNVKAQEHLDRLFIASVIKGLATCSDITLTSQKVHEEIAESLLNLEEGWWLHSRKETSGERDARAIATKVHSHYCRHPRPNFCINQGRANRTILPPSRGLADKSALAVLSCQALHHIEFYHVQQFQWKISIHWNLG